MKAKAFYSLCLAAIAVWSLTMVLAFIAGDRSGKKVNDAPLDQPIVTGTPVYRYDRKPRLRVFGESETSREDRRILNLLSNARNQSR